MPIKYPISELKSISGSQKIGKPNNYGEVVYAWSQYGDNNPVSGIWRIQHKNGKRYTQRMAFFDNRITHTIPQNARRTKFASAVSAWQAFTLDEKKVYNIKARGLNMYGYQLFISKYMKI